MRNHFSIPFVLHTIAVCLTKLTPSSLVKKINGTQKINLFVLLKIDDGTSLEEGEY